MRFPFRIFTSKSRLPARTIQHIQIRRCIIEPGMMGMSSWQKGKQQIFYGIGMLALLGVCFLNSYSEARGVWDETDEMYREALRVLHHPTLLERLGFPLETGLASQIQSPRSMTIYQAPFRYIMIYGTRMCGQVKVEFEELFRGWTAIHVNLENGERFSFYNPQHYNKPSDEEPAFHFLSQAELKDVLVEKGDHVDMPDQIPKAAWTRFYQCIGGLIVFSVGVVTLSFGRGYYNGTIRLRRHLNSNLTHNETLETILGFPLRLNRKDFGSLQIDGNKFFIASRIHGSIGTGQFCCYAEHDGKHWDFKESFVQVDEDMHSATRIDLSIEPIKMSLKGFKGGRMGAHNMNPPMERELDDENDKKAKSN